MTGSTQFCAWDGEGKNHNGSHRLMLLANSHGDHIIDKKLNYTWREWLPFLCQRQGFVHVWFSFGYDVNMIFKDLDQENSIKLFQEQRRIELDEYKIKYIPKKILIVTHGKQQYTHYDVFGFFQTSFINSLSDWKIQIPQIIHEGKVARAHFEKWAIEKIIEYNDAECQKLVELMTKLNECIQVARIGHMRSWHGAGAIASKFLHTWNFKNHKTNIVPDQHTQELFNARKMAYFGGRSELFYRGKIGKPVYRYDINSAYPHACQYLPSLHDRDWLHTKPNDVQDNDFALLYCKWSMPYDTRVGALPFRKNDNTIIFPRNGEGWYHLVEIRHALLKGYDIEILDAYVLDRRKHPYEYFLLDKLEPIALHRMELKKQKDLGHIPIKLGLNSIYGKLAQRPIKTADSIKKGMYTELFHAGFITAWTRAELLKYLNPNSVIMLATDGIFSTTKLNVPIGDDLGQWEYTKFDDGIFLLSGLYALKKNDEWTIKTRGYSNMTWQKFYRIYRQQVNQEAVHSNERRFISIKLALRAYQAYKRCEFQDIHRVINWNNNVKRIFKFPYLEASDSITVGCPPDQPVSKMYDMFANVDDTTNPELLAMNETYGFEEI